MHNLKTSFQKFVLLHRATKLLLVVYSFRLLRSLSLKHLNITEINGMFVWSHPWYFEELRRKEERLNLNNLLYKSHSHLQTLSASQSLVHHSVLLYWWYFVFYFLALPICSLVPLAFNRSAVLHWSRGCWFSDCLSFSSIWIHVPQE